MCEKKDEANAKLDRLIEAIGRLVSAISALDAKIASLPQLKHEPIR